MKTNPNDSINLEQHPVGGKVHNHGLTKREYFAAMAMQGLIAGLSSDHQPTEVDSKDATQLSVHAADALIEELNKENGK